MAWASGAHPTYLRARCPIAVRALLRQVRLAWTVSLEDGVFQEWLVEGAAPGPCVTNGRKPLPVPGGLGVPWARGGIKDELWNVGGNGSTVHEHSIGVLAQTNQRMIRV